MLSLIGYRNNRTLIILQSHIFLINIQAHFAKAVTMLELGNNRGADQEI